MNSTNLEKFKYLVIDELDEIAEAEQAVFIRKTGDKVHVIYHGTMQEHYEMVMQYAQQIMKEGLNKN